MAAVIIMGLTSILMQITALRQLFSVFSGNELDMGITLSVWLTAVGIGSYAGYRLRSKNAFAISFFAVALLSQLTVVFIYLIRPGLSIEFGETISLGQTLISTVISLMPLCFAIGMQFPLAVSYLRENTAKAYSLEAAGAFTGGILFTLLIAGNVDAFVLSMIIGIVNCIAGLLLLRKKSLIAVILIPLIIYIGINKLTTMLQWKDAELIRKVESKYGEITVLKTRGQLNVFSSGKFLFSYPDPQTEETKAHLPMTMHPSPDSVLVLGGSPSVLKEFLKYPLAKIDFVEIDPEMLNVSFSLLSDKDRNSLNDKRFKIITMDARKFIKASHGQLYDLVVFNLPEPSTANINRLYTVESFKEIKTLLKEDGIVFLSLPASPGYIGKRTQMANGSVFNSLKKVFKYVNVSSEEYGILLASNSFIDISPGILEGRFYGRKISTEFFYPYILKDAFSPLKVSMVRERLQKVNVINTDMKPTAYLYNLMLWAEVHRNNILMSVPEHGKWIIAFAIILLVLPIIFLWRKKQLVYYSIFTTGYSAMAFSIVIILAYQTVFGYVYETIGILTAAFMAGLALGSCGIRFMKSPLRWLRICEILTVMLLLSSPLLFKLETFFYLLSFLGGLIAGAEFAAANQFMKFSNPPSPPFSKGGMGGLSDTAMTAGKLYAIDLAGSFIGALLTTIFLVPLSGIQNAIMFVALLKAASLVLLFSLRYEDN